VNFNSVTLVGRVVEAPEQDGENHATFWLQVNRRWHSEERHEAGTEQLEIPVRSWGRLAELVLRNVYPGNTVLVHGRLKFDAVDEDPEAIIVAAKYVQWAYGSRRQRLGREEEVMDDAE